MGANVRQVSASAPRLCGALAAKGFEIAMDLQDLQWLFVILAIVAVGFFTALYLSTKYAKEADRAWPAIEAEAESASHN
jgi:hypothetical protein